MQLKGTIAPSIPAVISPEPLSKQEQARAEYEALQIAEATAITHYSNIQATYNRVQAQLSQASQSLDKIRARKAKVEVYVKDLDNSITAGRWYQFRNRWGSDGDDTPLVYIKEVRRPKKYTWVTMVLMKPQRIWDKGRNTATGNFEIAVIEANYPIIREYLKEETEQGRMGVLVRWGVSAENLLAKAEAVWGEKPPTRLTCGDPDWEVRRKNLLKVITPGDTK